MQGRRGHPRRPGGGTRPGARAVGSGPDGRRIDPELLVEAALAAAREALAARPAAGRGARRGQPRRDRRAARRGGEPVAPAIAWHDSRGEEQAERMVAELGGERFAERTGLAPRPLCSLVKYRWLRDEHEPAARGVRWLSVGEWIVHRLGGDRSPSCRSRRGPAGSTSTRAAGGMRRWHGRARRGPAARAGARDNPGRHGRRRAAARRGAVLAVGGHDHLSAAVGAGATGEGDVLVTWGTAQAFIRAVAPLAPPAWARRSPTASTSAGTPSTAPVPARRDALGRGAAARARPARRRAGGRAELERAALEAPPRRAGSSCTG